MKQYPSSPESLPELLVWLEWRNDKIKRYRPSVKTIGAGVPPKESK